MRPNNCFRTALQILGILGIGLLGTGVQAQEAPDKVINDPYEGALRYGQTYADHQMLNGVNYAIARLRGINKESDIPKEGKSEAKGRHNLDGPSGVASNSGSYLASGMGTDPLAAATNKQRAFGGIMEDKEGGDPSSGGSTRSERMVYSKTTLGSVHTDLTIGGNDGTEYGHLDFEREEPTPDIAEPVHWSYSGPDGVSVIRRSSDNSIHQIVTDDRIIEVVGTETNNGYITATEVRAFDIAPEGAIRTNGLYAPKGSKEGLATSKVERLTASGKEVRITHQKPDRTKIFMFTYVTNAENTVGLNGWEMTRGTGTNARIKGHYEQTVNWNGDTNAFRVVELIRNKRGDLLSRTEKIHREFDLEVRTNTYRWYDASVGGYVSEVVTNSLESQWKEVFNTHQVRDHATTTRWSYVESGTPEKNEAYGELKYRRDPGGDWVYFEYDDQGREKRRVESYLGSDFAQRTNYSLHRVTEYDYSAVNTNDNLNIAPVRPRTVTKKREGEVVSRFFRIITPEYTKEIQAATPSSDWNDPRNVMKMDLYYVRNGDRNRRFGTVHPDGTISNMLYDIR